MDFPPLVVVYHKRTESPIHAEPKQYEADDLQRVIDNLPITEGVGSKISGTSWIPLIAMYSGLRLEEICQLTSADISVLDGVLYFDLTRGKNLKTVSAARIVAVHPELLSLGLQAYVKSVQYGNLWGLKKVSGSGWSKQHSQKFGRWARKFVTKDPLKVFHSFRHSVARRYGLRRANKYYNLVYPR